MNKKIITKTQAIKNLETYIGKDLSEYAKKLKVTIFKNGKQNKGWKGEVLEKLSGLTGGTSRAPNGLTFELKSVAFVKKGEKLEPKETMAITMINPEELINTEFFQSHCWFKLKSMIFCAVLWHGYFSPKSELLNVSSFQFVEDGDLINEIKNDYEFIRNKLINEGFENLTGKDGKWIQARTKGRGRTNPRTGIRRPITRAFYTRRSLLTELLKD